jgi:hypothetical protein
VLSLRVSRDKRGYDHIYLLLEARRRGRVENRLLYCGRWPSPCRVGQPPFDDETRSLLEQAHPDVPFDWAALLKTLQAALGVSRPPLSGPPPPPSRSRRPPAPASETPYAQGGRPGGPSQPADRLPSPSSRPDWPRPTESEPGERGGREGEREYAPGQVVLVSAEFEEPDTGFAEPAEPGFAEPELAEPGFEPVCQEDRQFAAGVNLELVTDQILHLEVARSAPTVTPPTDGQLFAQASGPATFDPDPEPAAATGAAGANATTEPGAVRPQRRRRRRGGRGRGKPPDLRQGSE